MKQAQEDSTDTATQILDVAERLVQVRGFNAFSYADVAGELGLTNAALHYHFPSKAELGEALIARYAIRFMAALGEIDESLVRCSSQARSPIPSSTSGVLRSERMCLCGMLAADYETLSPGMKGAVVRLLRKERAWLTEVLQQGRDDGSLSFAWVTTRRRARSIVSGLEGAMLIARSIGDIKRFKSAASHLLTALRP